MDFSKTLIRCSSIHKIMADPMGAKPFSDVQLARMKELQLRHADALNEKAKPLTDKMLAELDDLLNKRNNPRPPELSLTTKTELIDIYLFEKFGLRSLDKDKMIMYTEKGKMVEEDSINLLASQDKTIYFKNTERFNNEFITGEPDIILDDKIIDVKSSWDAESFMRKILGSLDPTYYWQMQGYMALKQSPKAQVCYCLVDTPESLINDEKRRLFYSMGVATDQDPIYQMLAQSIEHNMKFSHIEPRLRVMRFNVNRDDSAIEKIYER